MRQLCYLLSQFLKNLTEDVSVKHKIFFSLSYIKSYLLSTYVKGTVAKCFIYIYSFNFYFFLLWAGLILKYQMKCYKHFPEYGHETSLGLILVLKISCLPASPCLVHRARMDATCLLVPEVGFSTPSKSL